MKNSWLTIIALLSLVLVNSSSAEISLNSPNGGETFSVGDVIHVEWSAGIEDTAVILEINFGNGWFNMVEIMRPDNWVTRSDPEWGDFSFTIPSFVTHYGEEISIISDSCKVRVLNYSNLNINDVSNAYFAIVQSNPGNVLTAMPIKISVEQNETVEFSPVFKGLDTAGKTVRIQTATVNGVLTIVNNNFKFVPNNNFTGSDSFTWKVDNGAGSSNVAKCKLKIHPPEPGGMTVMLVVNDLLYPKISSEIDRLKSDLESEGYVVRIKPWSVTGSFNDNNKVKVLWDTLVQEYDSPDRFLAGTILIGKIPFSYDRAYWSMSQWYQEIDSTVYGYTGRTAAHIWQSRMWAQDKD